MKKAIAVTELMILILAIASGIGLIFFAKEGFEKAGCQRDLELCKSTFAFFQKWRSLGWLGVAPRVDCVAISPPNCKDKELKKDKPQKVMHIIAENLRWCWDKTLGKVNTMGEDFAEAIVVSDDVDFCLVCSEFRMPKDVTITKDEWNKYLDTITMPGRDVTYEQFIDTPDQVWGKNYRDRGFEGGKKYVVVSVSAEATKDDNIGRIYIDEELYCGTIDPQIHYQLK